MLSFLELCLLTLWLYLSGFLANTFAMMWGKWLPKTGYGPWPIDGGKMWSDGNRILGDGKTWNGLIGGSLTSGLLCMLMVWMTDQSVFSTLEEVDTIFASPISGASGTWFDTGGEMGTAFLLGTFLGFSCLIGDSVGSFIKRRRGLKREGNVSSKAPLLDTLPFAIMVFLMGQLFLGQSVLADNALISSMVVLVIITPVLHRSFNLIGYGLGWKDVPY